MENLIFSSGYGYPPTYLQTFLRSIARNMKSADVILFYHDTSEKCVSHLRAYLGDLKVVKPGDYLVRRAIGILPKGKRRTSRLFHQLAIKLGIDINICALLLSAAYNPIIARYFWIRDYCNHVDVRQYKKLMLCDSRDVVFQSDAFDKIDDMSFVTGLEERRIGECPVNQRWISRCYGEQVLNALAGEPILCAGVSLGSRETVLKYVDSMVQEFERLDRRLAGLEYGEDQAVHNYLIRSNLMNVVANPTKIIDGIIATLHYYDRGKINIGTNGAVSVESNVTPSIIHQYDRFPELREHCSKFYG